MVLPSFGIAEVTKITFGSLSMLAIRTEVLRLRTASPNTDEGFSFMCWRTFLRSLLATTGMDPNTRFAVSLRRSSLVLKPANFHSRSSTSPGREKGAQYCGQKQDPRSLVGSWRPVAQPPTRCAHWRSRGPVARWLLAAASETFRKGAARPATSRSTLLQIDQRARLGADPV